MKSTGNTGCMQNATAQYEVVSARCASRRNWILPGALSLVLALLAGCQCINVTHAERSQIDQLHSEGISWAGNPPAGYSPAVNMTAAIFWGILPGAGQMFAAHKMDDAGIIEHDFDKTSLNGSGFAMLALSWIPYVYEFTLPCGIGGVVVDVNRVNNIHLLQYIDRKNKEATKAAP